MGKVYFASLFVLSLFACDQTSNIQVNKTNIVNEPMVDLSSVLVTVDESSITEFQLDSAINRTLGDSAALYGDQNFQQKMLQSLIVSRTMSLLAEKQLDQEEISALDEKVRRYREELLVKRYLQSNTQVEPVTSEQIKLYYDKYPEQFGAEVVKEFELLVSSGNLAASEKVALLKSFDAAKSEKDWRTWSNSLSSNKLTVSYKKATAKLSVLSGPLQKLLAKTAPGSTSEVHFGEQLMIARVINEELLPVKDLAQVSIEIRKKLAPVNMKKAVKIASELAKKQVKIDIK